MKITGGRGGTGSNRLRERVKKKAGKIKASSRRWIDRHINDPYVHKTKEAGYRSRAAFKLLEINHKYSILKKGFSVIDLGSAPGGWSQVAVECVHSNDTAPRVVGIDYLEMQPVSGALFLQIDFLDPQASEKLLNALGRLPDVVLSDMAAPTTGHRSTDHLKTAYLYEVAADFALSVLKPGGSFLAKTFRGGSENKFLSDLKKNFSRVSHVKPPASRPESVELYLLAQGFKGR